MATNMLLSEVDRVEIIKRGDLAFKDNSYEFECIVGQKPNREPFTDKKSYLRVRDYCRKKSCLPGSDYKVIKERSISLDISCDSEKGQSNYRVTILGEHYIKQFCKDKTLSSLPKGSWFVIDKPRSPSYNMESIDCRLNLKQEIPIDPKNPDFELFLSSWVNKRRTLRLKNRTSYLVNNRYSVDLTVVKENKLKKIRSKIMSNFIKPKFVVPGDDLDKNGDQTKKFLPEKYEIEIEFIPEIMPDNSYEFDIESWKKTVQDIMCVCLDSWRLQPISFNGGVSNKKLLKKIENDYFFTLTGKEESLIGPNGEDNKTRYGLGPKVVSLSMERLRKLKRESVDEYFVCPKSDGVRMTGFINIDGELYLFGSQSRYFQPTGVMFDKSAAQSIFDGELIMNEKEIDGKCKPIIHYLIFDCYYDNSEDIRQLNFMDRQQHCENLMEKIVDVQPAYNGLRCMVYKKKMIKITSDNDLHKACVSCFDDIEEDKYENDGLIFTPNDKVGGNDLYKKQKGFIKSGYEFPRMLKWKDANYNSIDFKIKFIKETDGPLKIGDKYIFAKYQICHLYISNVPKQRDFTIMDFEKYFTQGTPSVFDSEKYKHDLVVIKKGDKGKKTVFKTYSEPQLFKPFEPVDPNAFEVKLPIIDGHVRCNEGGNWSGLPIANDDIVEMTYDIHASEEYRWIPIRIRKDKDRPNNYHVAQDIWKSYFSPVTKEIMMGVESIPTEEEELDIYYNTETSGSKNDENLRLFHRLVIKDKIFQLTLGNTESKVLLDLGSGKAGDLSRYIEYKADKVVGIDNSVDNLHNVLDGAYKRVADSFMKMAGNKKTTPLLENKDTILFLAADAGKDLKQASSYHGLYKDRVLGTNNPFNTPHTFDVATVFFALHYFFKNEETVNYFLNNVADNVKVGGYFGGCCYNGETIANKFKETNDMDLVFKEDGVEILRIIKNYDGEFDNTVDSLGKEIRCLVQSIGTIHNEFLVNFEYLKNKMFNLGFEEVSTHNFQYYYDKQDGTAIKMGPGQREASFLNRTFIFRRERIPKVVKVNRTKLLKKT
tara:strand:+ start:7234 stop:10371 length:3138 start_codon:yes stop_codon:yes gene_type:complete